MKKISIQYYTGLNISTGLSRKMPFLLVENQYKEAVSDVLPIDIGNLDSYRCWSVVSSPGSYWCKTIYIVNIV